VLAIAIGLVLIWIGFNSVRRREAKFSLDEDGEGARIVEGWPAVLIGLIEISIGIVWIVNPNWL